MSVKIKIIMILICNLCFRQKSQSIELFLTNCRHVFCNNCLFQINKKCFVCSKMFESIKIDFNMPEPIRRLFVPLDVELRKIQTIRRFQMEQIYYYTKRKAQLIPNIFQNEKKRQEIREKMQIVKQAKQQEHSLILRLNEFEKSLTPKFTKLRMANSILFDDSPEILRKRDDISTKSKTDSGYYRK